MKNIVFGKVTETKFYLDKLKNKDGWIAVPEIKSEVKDVEKREIASWDGTQTYNDKPASYIYSVPKYLNINEDTEVRINKTIFRADLGEIHHFTDYVIENTDVDKEDTENLYKKMMAKFNHDMILADDKLLAYCNLHKLNISNTDVFDLYKVVYGEDAAFKDGNIYSKKNIDKWLSCYGLKSDGVFIDGEFYQFNIH